MPVPCRALLGGKVGHHDEVQTGGFPIGIGVWDDILIDEDLAVSPLHGGDEVGQDLATVVIIPVVQDRVHVVSPRTYLLY